MNQIVLENDLIVASIGRKIFAWKAGSGKGRQSGAKDSGRRGSAQRDIKGSARAIGGLSTPKSTDKVDMRSVREDTADSYSEFQTPSRPPRTIHERQQFAAMDNLGLEDGDDALQYALMLSIDDQGGPSEILDDDEPYEVDDSPASTPARSESSTPFGTSFDSRASTPLESFLVTRTYSSAAADRLAADAAAAVRAVEAFEAAQRRETEEMLEMIKIAEDNEQDAPH